MEVILAHPFEKQVSNRMCNLFQSKKYVAVYLDMSVHMQIEDLHVVFLPETLTGQSSKEVNRMVWVERDL